MKVILCRFEDAGKQLLNGVHDFWMKRISVEQAKAQLVSQKKQKNQRKRLEEEKLEEEQELEEEKLEKKTPSKRTRRKLLDSLYGVAIM